jgi:hypothetical protein
MVAAQKTGGVMGEPVLHQGEWWFQHDNGAWSRWDAATQGWVPHQAVYYPAAPTPIFNPLARLSRWVIGLIAADMVLSVVTIFVALNDLATLDELADVTIEEFARTGFGQSVASQVSGIASFAAGILFMIWFYRAYQNLFALRTQGRYGTGWAIGAWLVPILNLWRPKQIADDIWRSSDPDLPPNPANIWHAVKVPALMNYWWAAWVVANLAPFVAFPVAFVGADLETEPFGAFIRSFSLVAISTGAGRIIAGALAIPVVKQMTERQERRAADLGVLPPNA